MELLKSFGLRFNNAIYCVDTLEAQIHTAWVVETPEVLHGSYLVILTSPRAACAHRNLCAMSAH